jgi:gamma-glutamylcyclotransferase (GGCT)/AIG2-like uncharacterized protein YtfP
MKNEKQLPVFCYGTLRNGLGNYQRLLKGNTTTEHAAVTTGTMYSVHHGGFPVLKKEFIPDTELIKGELMYIDPEKYEEVLRSLDWLEGYNRRRPEGSMYIREQARVFNESIGQFVDAYVYYWNGSVEGMERVESGCWNEYKMATRKICELCENELEEGEEKFCDECDEMLYDIDGNFKKWVVLDGDLVLEIFETEKEAAGYIGQPEEEFLDEMYNDDFNHVGGKDE